MMDSRMSLQSLTDSEVFSPCSFEHQDVFMYEDDKRCFDGEDRTYTDLSASKTAAFPAIKTEPDPDTLMSWTQKHPEHWTQNEILDWIYFVAGTIDVDHTTIRGEGFQNITGPELCRMTLDDFQKRDPVNGRCFYDMFRSLHKDAYFIEPQVCDFNTTENYNYTYHTIKTEHPEIKEENDQSELNTKCLDSIVVNEKEMQVRLGEFWYPIDCVEDTDMGAVPDLTWLSPECSGGSDSESVSDASESSIKYTMRTDSVGSDGMSDDDDASMISIIPSHIDCQKPALKRKPASHRKKNPSGGENDKQQNRGRKPGQISKGNHLWEFIRDLLKDPKFNPHLLRWEEKDTGVFRFVQSEAVAQMWGRKKNNPAMTYEKLSRAMRFCRTAGYFAEVPKTGKFPKKLCFRFGEKASGWND